MFRILKIVGTMLPILTLLLVSGCGKGKSSVSAGDTGSGKRQEVTSVSDPVVLIPASIAALTNSENLLISGTCTDGYLVYLAEVVESVSQTPVSVTCSGSAFSFLFQPSGDGLHSFELQQRSVFDGEPLEYYSNKVSASWMRDTTPPAAPQITSPVSNPYMSAGNSVTISGTCESTAEGNAIVYLGGTSTQEVVCSGGSFSFTYPNSVDGTYNFTLKQVDPAGNGTSAPYFTWIREAKPSTPFITSPATSPVVNNLNQLTITGTCTSTYQVEISGVTAGEVISPVGSLTQTCSSSSFSYTIAKSGETTYPLSITQKNLITGVTSNAATVQWKRDVTPPSAPGITAPAANPYYSNATTLTISGSCEDDATVRLTGSSSQNMVCVGGAFSFSVSKASDATYSFSLTQTDLASNISGSTSLNWVRDTVAPAAPTQTAPGSNPLNSGDATITIGGGCETDATVYLSGASTQEMVCSGSAYSFSVTKLTEDTFNFSLLQKDRALNTSGSIFFEWHRDTGALSVPTILSPATNPLYSTSTTLTLQGGCSDGATVYLSGDVNAGEMITPALSLSTTCSSSAYMFVVSKTTDGTYNLAVHQEQFSKVSDNATFQWVLDRVVPSNPAITSPAVSPYYSNGDLLTLSGTCEANAAVSLSGSSTQSTTCSAGGAFSFAINKTTNATYNFQVAQADRAGNASGSVSFEWTRDTAAPAAPGITSPASNPYISSGNLYLTGTCETGNTVTIGGNVVSGDIVTPAGALSQTCSGGVFSYQVSKSSDGTYDLSLTQRDRALNLSPAAALQYVKDTEVPDAPLITSPAANPYYSSSDGITISGTCVADFNLTLSGASDQTAVCSAGGTFSFSFTPTADDTYIFYLEQENPTTEISSSQASLEWIRDKVSPAAPVRLNPTTTPYTSSGSLLVSGKCEPFATVSLSGDASASTPCDALGTYSMSVASLPDGGPYTFYVSQTDRASNSSSSISFVWTRNSSVPGTPTISTPNVNPYIQNGNSITIAGGCITGYTVTLGGEVIAGDVSSPAGSLTQVCASSSYSYTINKTVDGNYDFTVKQSNGGPISGAIGLQWIRDNGPPTITLTATPTNPNLALDSNFVFSANEVGVVFECSLDGADFSVCTSPQTFTELANGNHSFSVRGTDEAGNPGNTASYSWTQNAHRTIALYHMDASAPTEDSGLYTGGDNNSFTVNTSTTSATGKFAEGRSFAGAGIMSAPDSPSLNALSGKMTVEAWVKITTMPSSGYYVIASQYDATGTYGWELRYKRGTASKGKFSLYVKFSASVSKEVVESGFALSTTTFYHVAGVFNKGTMQLYRGGARKVSSTATVTTLPNPTSLPNSTHVLRVGQSPTTANILKGVVDELRISQYIRYAGTYTVPTNPFTAD